jgi:hypothetical protein
MMALEARAGCPRGWFAVNPGPEAPIHDRLRAISLPSDELLIVFIAAPRGDALSPGGALDLSRTTPPVAGIVDLVAATLADHKVLFAIQVYENVVDA